MKWRIQAGGPAPANSEKGGQINICPSPELCLYQQNLNTEKSRIPPNKKVWRLGKNTPPNEICSQGNYINFRSPHGLGIADDQIECALKSVISILDGQIGAISLWGHIMIRSAGRRVYIALGLVRGAHSLLHQTVISIHV